MPDPKADLSDDVQAAVDRLTVYCKNYFGCDNHTALEAAYGGFGIPEYMQQHSDAMVVARQFLFERGLIKESPSRR